MTAQRAQREWFDAPEPESGEPGLRFACTACGNCCSGPSGYVTFTDAEADDIAAALHLSRERFLDAYTTDTPVGRSLREVRPLGRDGYDCVFLDRDTSPGKALCSIYAHRPEQCRTWPFWGSNLASRRVWERAAKNCPGMNTGPLHTPKHIRLTRDRVDI